MQLARRSSHFLDFSGCVSPRRNYKNSWPTCMPRSIFFAIFCFNFCDFFAFFLPRILPRISPSPATAFEPVPFLALPGQAMPSHAEAKPEPSQARPERERERETLDFIFDRETRTMKTIFFTHETGFQQTLPYSYVTLLSAALAPRIDRCFRSHPPEAARYRFPCKVLL